MHTLTPGAPPPRNPPPQIPAHNACVILDIVQRALRGLQYFHAAGTVLAHMVADSFWVRYNSERSEVITKNGILRNVHSVAFANFGDDSVSTFDYHRDGAVSNVPDHRTNTLVIGVARVTRRERSAPEILESAAPDTIDFEALKKADVWSLGMLLVEYLFGASASTGEVYGRYGAPGASATLSGDYNAHRGLFSPGTNETFLSRLLGNVPLYGVGGAIFPLPLVSQILDSMLIRDPVARPSLNQVLAQVAEVVDGVKAAAWKHLAGAGVAEPPSLEELTRISFAALMASPPPIAAVQPQPLARAVVKLPLPGPAAAAKSKRLLGEPGVESLVRLERQQKESEDEYQRAATEKEQMRQLAEAERQRLLGQASEQRHEKGIELMQQSAERQQRAESEIRRQQRAESEVKLMQQAVEEAEAKRQQAAEEAEAKRQQAAEEAARAKAASASKRRALPSADVVPLGSASKLPGSAPKKSGSAPKLSGSASKLPGSAPKKSGSLRRALKKSGSAPKLPGPPVPGVPQPLAYTLEGSKSSSMWPTTMEALRDMFRQLVGIPNLQDFTSLLASSNMEDVGDDSDGAIKKPDGNSTKQTWLKVNGIQVIKLVPFAAPETYLSSLIPYLAFTSENCGDAARVVPCLQELGVANWSPVLGGPPSSHLVLGLSSLITEGQDMTLFTLIRKLRADYNAARPIARYESQKHPNFLVCLDLVSQLVNGLYKLHAKGVSLGGRLVATGVRVYLGPPKGASHHVMASETLHLSRPVVGIRFTEFNEACGIMYRPLPLPAMEFAGPVGGDPAAQYMRQDWKAMGILLEDLLTLGYSRKIDSNPIYASTDLFTPWKSLYVDMTNLSMLARYLREDADTLAARRWMLGIPPSASTPEVLAHHQRMLAVFNDPIETALRGHSAGVAKLFPSVGAFVGPETLVKIFYGAILAAFTELGYVVPAGDLAAINNTAQAVFSGVIDAWRK